MMQDLQQLMATKEPKYLKIFRAIVWERAKGELNALALISEDLDVPIKNFITVMNDRIGERAWQRIGLKEPLKSLEP